MKKKIICTVGVPRSGKSTVSQKLKNTFGYPIVEPDAVRLALHGKRFIAEREKEVWNIVFTMARALLIAGHDTIVVDATNVHQKARNAWRKKFPDCDFRWIVVDTDIETCKERAILTRQEDLIPVIDRMAGKFVHPKEDNVEGELYEDYNGERSIRY